MSYLRTWFYGNIWQLFHVQNSLFNYLAPDAVGFKKQAHVICNYSPIITLIKYPLPNSPRCYDVDGSVNEIADVISVLFRGGERGGSWRGGGNLEAV